MAQKKKKTSGSAPKGKRRMKKGASWHGSREGLSGGTIALIALLGVAAMVVGHLLQNGLAKGRAQDGAESPLRLNEVMSENTMTLVTETGDVPDWIEICNTGDEAVEVGKHMLLLESNLNKAFSFPDATLEPGECLLVYADGSTRGGWNAPFKLPASGGDTLVLLNAQGKAIDSLSLPELDADVSYAINESGYWAVCNAATPGAPNDEAAASASTGVQAQADALEITEAMSSNSLYFADESGEKHDYVEIHNRSNGSVNLAGWYLSDSSDQLKRWAFPDVSIPAGGYLAVHCSGYNRTADPAHLHTDFKLSGDGETIYLSRPDGRTVSMAALPALEANQAYSLVDGAWTVNLAPTPGLENSAAAAAQLNAYHFGDRSGMLGISEIMAAPTEQDYDWVELYNGSNQTIDLGGYGLSDNSKRPRKWQFPAGSSIRPGEYMVVCLSGENVPQMGGFVNASFALAAQGGYSVTLSDPAGNILDAAYLPQQYGGSSYGRMQGQPGFYYLSSATPGAANNGAAYLDRAQGATYSVQGGLFTSGESFQVELSAPAGSRIYYTLDCTDPDEGSIPYSGPIPVSSTTIIRTRVYRDGCMPSIMDAQSYLYDVQNHGVYVVSLVSDPDNLYSNDRGILIKGPNAWAEPPYGEINQGANFWMDWEREGHVELFEADGDVAISQEIGLKLHGQYSRQQEVKAFKIFARSEYGENRFDYPIFSNRDYDEYQSFLLRASGQDFDKAFMRDALLTSLAADTSVMYQESEPAICYLNGEYYSMFWLRERVSRFSICQFEGWEGMEDDLDLIKANEIEKEGSNASFEELLAWIKKNDTSTQAAYDYIAQRIDVQNYIEYMALQIFSGNGDTLNVKRYRNDKVDGKWRWVVYDLDWAFTVDTNSINRWLDPQGMGTGKYTDTTLFIGCMKNPIFRDQFLTYFGERMATTFTTENLLRMIDERYAMIEPLLPQYLARIGVSEKTYQKELETLREYARTRPKKILGYFDKVFDFSDAQKQQYFSAALEVIQ